MYGFVHRAFLEYLAAADICGRFAAHEISAEDLAHIFAERWKDPAWHEVLVLASGMIPAKIAGKVITWLLRAEPLWSMRPWPPPIHVQLAVRCLGEVRKPGEIAGCGLSVATALISILDDWENDNGVAPPNPTPDFRSVVLPVLARLGPNWSGRPVFEDWYLSG